MHEGPTLQATELLVLLLLASSLVGILAHRVNVPYTVALVLCGMLLGATGAIHGQALTPSLVLFVFLPGLLFEAAFHLHLDHLKRTFGAVVALAGPGLLITMGIVACMVHWVLGTDWAVSILLGAMVSATDPIAVLAVFRRLGVPKRLSTLVEGESLFNDGVALVVFSSALGVAVGGHFDAGQSVVAFLVAVAGGVVVGGTSGFVASRVTAHVDDHLVEMTLATALAYGTYLVSEFFGVSGVLATITAGLVFGNYGRARGMSTRTQEALDDLWEYAAFLLNSLVFLLLGAAFDISRLLADVAAVGVVVVATTVGRAVAVYGLGTGATLLRIAVLPRRWRHVVFWSGLRGALSLAMALSLPPDTPQRDLLVTLVAGVVLVTILVQGSTIDPIARRLIPIRHGGSELLPDPARAH